jgi:deoxyribonuclease V
VVRADGSLGPVEKLASPADRIRAGRLMDEGVTVRSGKVDLAQFGFDDFHGPRPLEVLRKLQADVPRQTSATPLARTPRLVAGLDVSYIAEDAGIGGYALVDCASGELVWSTTVRCHVPFPYITSYLTFRELPVLSELLAAAKAADRLADVYLIDGAGIMHPRRAGVATHLGVVADVPTIGVTKKLLAGRFDETQMTAGQPRDVTEGDEQLGVAIRPRSSSKRMIYVSPGHRIDVAGATAVVRQLLRGRRLPEPIYWADNLSRRAAASE